MQSVEKSVDNLHDVGCSIINLQNVEGNEDNMGLTVKQWRLAKGLSQDDMAKHCGVHRNTYASWEDKPESITIGNAKLIAKVLGESVNTIFFWRKYLQNVDWCNVKKQKTVRCRVPNSLLLNFLTLCTLQTFVTINSTNRFY